MVSLFTDTSHSRLGYEAGQIIYVVLPSTSNFQIMIALEKVYIRRFPLSRRNLVGPLFTSLSPLDIKNVFISPLWCAVFKLSYKVFSGSNLSY